MKRTFNIHLCISISTSQTDLSHQFIHNFVGFELIDFIECDTYKNFNKKHHIIFQDKEWSMETHTFIQ